MDYLSVPETAARWQLSVRRVQTFCTEGRIPGAKKYGNYWMIPEDAPRPSDPRRSKGGTAAGAGQACASVILIGSTPYTVGNIERILPQLSSETARMQATGELHYFRGEPELAAPLFEETCRRERTRPGGLVMRAVTAVALDDGPAFLDAVSTLNRESAAAHAGPERMTLELAISILSSSLYAPEQCPDWLAAGEIGRLPENMRPLGCYLYAKYLHSVEALPRMLGVSEAALGAYAGAGYHLSEIYLHLMAAMALIEFKARDKALSHLRAALDLALPDGILMPFAENYLRLDRTLKLCLADSDPETLARIVARSDRTWRNWIAMHNAVTRDKAPLLLTLKEFQAASLAARGCGNAEISLRLDIKEQEVRALMRSIYQKLNIKRREELRKYAKI